MNRKIIFFDIDGTIFSTRIGRVTDRVKASIAQAQKRGHLCFIASGRPWSFIAGNIKAMGFDGYVLANGAHIRYLGRDLGIRHLPREDVDSLCRSFRKKGIQYILSTPSYSYLDPAFTSLLNFYRGCNIDMEQILHDFEEEEVLDRTIKVEAWMETQEQSEYAASCCGAFASEIRGPGQTTEFYGKQVSKATGIKEVLQMLSIPVEDSFCFGDGPNDVEMFETVGNGFAMENGVTAVKSIAQKICPSVEDDGVAVAMAELFKRHIL